ncbi:MAG: hypothetical protein LLF83_01670 [Methanobacterium sp.]|nr:hypothetical protein [Methanobacterium sp.]
MSRKLLLIIILLIIVLFVYFSGFISSKEYKVGNSSFSVPNDFINTSQGNTPYSSEILLIKNTTTNYSIRMVGVTQFTNQTIMNDFISIYSVPNADGTHLWSQNNTTINGVNVKIFDGQPFGNEQYLFFEKNGKYYQIYIQYNDTSQNKDLANMIIGSLR